MEEGAGIYRDEGGAAATCEIIAKLRQRYKKIEVNDKSNVFNTDLQTALELRNLLDVAETVAEGSRSVYGLTEHARDAIRSARLVANPGCYPTSITPSVTMKNSSSIPSVSSKRMSVPVLSGQK